MAVDESDLLMRQDKRVTVGFCILVPFVFTGAGQETKPIS